MKSAQKISPLLRHAEHLASKLPPKAKLPRNFNFKGQSYVLHISNLGRISVTIAPRQVRPRQIAAGASGAVR